MKTEMKFEKTKNGLPSQSHGEPKDDLFICLRPLLVFGRLIGIIPFEGIYQKQYHLLKFRKKSYAAVKSIIVCILVGIGMIIAIVGPLVSGGSQNATALAWNLASPGFYAHGFFLYCYFYIHSDLLIKIFAEWTKISLCYTKEDTTLFLHANLIVLVTFISAILENACLHLDYFDIYQNDQHNLQVGKSSLAIYYHRSHSTWEKILPYNEFWAILAFVLNKLILYTWNFVDVLLAVLSRAIYYKYKNLNEESARTLLDGSSFHDTEEWKALTRDHMKISNLLADFEKFTSPLIFASYTINTFFICIQLNLGLTPNPDANFVKSAYAVWSFLHLTMRIFILSLNAARINEEAHKISHILRKCPLQNYCLEIERTERRILSGPIGLTGLGCFRITKSFILKILSTVFTFEIVLLQASNSVSSVVPGNCSITNTGSNYNLNKTS